MENTVNQRLKKFVESKDFPAKVFAEKFGATDKEINNWTTSTKIALPRLSDLALAYPELNIRWLLTGQGKMTEEEENQVEVNDKHHEYFKECPMCKEKNQVIEAQRRLIANLERECAKNEELLDWYKGKKETAPENSAQHRQAANE